MAKCENLSMFVGIDVQTETETGSSNTHTKRNSLRVAWRYLNILATPLQANIWPPQEPATPH